jgi:P-type Ca2+ transporter type 2C
MLVALAKDESDGWMESTAIFIAVFLISNITAANDYSKQLQFRALETTCQQEECASVVRNDGLVQQINTSDLVVGDVLLLQTGDCIPADCVIVEKKILYCNESSLTGESEDLMKSYMSNVATVSTAGDCFLLASSLISSGEETKAVVIAVGKNSQYGALKSSLDNIEPVSTPLQVKLGSMAHQIAIIGIVVAIACFIGLLVHDIRADAKYIDSSANLIQSAIKAFMFAVTVIVIAIPEGLPLAVTLSLAYSMKAMYADHLLVRNLAACETMGNVTNICSDKTGTLTNNCMSVVEGWFAGQRISVDVQKKHSVFQDSKVEDLIITNIAVNRSAYIVIDPIKGEKIIGNKTEGALLALGRMWNYDCDMKRNESFDEGKDKFFAFNSFKKRSTVVIHRADGSVTLFCKGAAEDILSSCTSTLTAKGETIPMTSESMQGLSSMFY